MIFVTGTPKDQVTEHPGLPGALARLLKKQDARAKLMSAFAPQLKGERVECVDDLPATFASLGQARMLAGRKYPGAE